MLLIVLAGILLFVGLGGGVFETAEVTRLFKAPFRPPFRAGWEIPTRDGVKTLCKDPPDVDGSVLQWPLEDFDASHGLTYYSGKIGKSDKPNPDAVPICDRWKTSRKSPHHVQTGGQQTYNDTLTTRYSDRVSMRASVSSCSQLCTSLLSNSCRQRKQAWRYFEWKTPTEDFEDGSDDNWNGPYDCVYETMYDDCQGPCRSASQPDKEVPCHIRRNVCTTQFLGPGTITTAPPTEATIMSQATSAEEAESSSQTEILENDNGWNSGQMIGTTVISAGGAAAGVGLCCHCSGGGSAQLTNAPGIKDLGTTLGGGADDVSRMVHQKCEAEEDRAGNKEAMEAELAARMSVALAASDLRTPNQ